MKARIAQLLSLIFIFISSCNSNQEKHLFILSGQSNMERLRIQESFIPTIESELGKKQVIIVKHTKDGQGIRHWYKNPNQPNDQEFNPELDLYGILINKVYTVIKNERIKSVTLIWMHGESDAKEILGEGYEKSLNELYKQLSNDLKRHDINFLIGRLNDFDMQNKKYLHWTMIREIQVKIANSNPRFDWINTDDLNDGLNREGKIVKNGLHMSKEGYTILGKRFAEKAILIIKNN